jgi:hypothetical protein
MLENTEVDICIVPHVSTVDNGHRYVFADQEREVWYIVGSLHASFGKVYRSVREG